MTNVLAVELGLPPGLWLPLPEEDTEQYRRERFNHANHDIERVVDLGAFATALIVLEAEDTKRVNFMPRQEDLEALFRAGYGISKHHIDRSYGGLSNIQRRLGFYPRNAQPDKAEVLERAQWMAEYALPLDEDFDMPGSWMQDILRWGAKRHLLPSEEYVRKLFDDDQASLQQIFGKERPNAKQWYTKLDLHKFGARILAEHGAPITRDNLNLQYGPEFIGNPDHIITEHFGTAAHFWAEFGWYVNQKGMKPGELIDIGVRFLLAHPEVSLSYPRAEELCAEGRFPSPYLLETHFDRFTIYREKVIAILGQYADTHDELVAAGVSEEVMQLVGQKFDSATNSFDHWRKHVEALKAVSADTVKACYIRVLMARGMDLLSDEVYELQKEDLLRYARSLKIGRMHDLRYLLKLVPYADVNEWLPLPVPRWQRKAA